jgi:hypothetical protein
MFHRGLSAWQNCAIVAPSLVWEVDPDQVTRAKKEVKAMNELTPRHEGMNSLTLEVEQLEDRLAPGAIGIGVGVGVGVGVAIGGDGDDDHDD